MAYPAVRPLPKLPLPLRTYGQTRVLPLSWTTCSARTSPSTILHHRPPKPAPERSSDLKRYSPIFTSAARNTCEVDEIARCLDEFSQNAMAQTVPLPSQMTSPCLNPTPSPCPPSLHFPDFDELQMPPALTLPAAASTPHAYPHSTAYPVGPQLWTQSPGHLTIDVIVTAMPPDQPPLPPIYGDRSPTSSSGSSASSLSLKAAPLLNVQYQRACDRCLSGDLRMDPLPLEGPRSRWTCW